MALSDLSAKVPLIGMSMVFAAMGVVAITAYLHVGWYSIVGYVLAAVIAVFGFVFTFRDLSDAPDPRPVSHPPGAEEDGSVHN